MPEAPHRPEGRNVDAPGLADAAEVVADQVDDHQVLGGVFLRREKGFASRLFASVDEGAAWSP